MVENDLRDVIVWYHENKGRIPRENLRKRLDFTETALNNAFNVMISMCEELQKVRGKPSALWLPNGMKVSGDVKRFG